MNRQRMSVYFVCRLIFCVKMHRLHKKKFSEKEKMENLSVREDNSIHL